MIVSDSKLPAHDKWLLENMANGYLTVHAAASFATEFITRLLAEGKVKEAYVKGPHTVFKLTADGWGLVKVNRIF